MYGWSGVEDQNCRVVGLLLTGNDMDLDSNKVGGRAGGRAELTAVSLNIHRRGGESTTRRANFSSLSLKYEIKIN